MKEKSCVALNHASHLHYNDHLAPISVVMKIPLLVVDQHDYDICKKYYPDVNVILSDYDAFNPEELIKHYDVLFMSDLWDRQVLREKFFPLELKYHKILRNVHVPHGFSDKGFYISKAANEDIVLVYGQNMLDMFHHEGLLKNVHQYVMTGNYRYTYYKMHRKFYDDVIAKEVSAAFEKPRKTILYAPTWMDLEESSTFFDSISYVLDNIPEDFNVIVKPHPRLELDDTTLYYQILGKYKDHPQILFLTDFPLVYPLINIVDIYLGDMSSIGYDYLIYNRPMFFLNKENRNPQRDRRSYLFNCGVDIKSHQFPRLYQIIEANLERDAEKFTNIRAEVWEYTFGEERSFDKIQADVIKAYNEPRKEIEL